MARLVRYSRGPAVRETIASRPVMCTTRFWDLLNRSSEIDIAGLPPRATAILLVTLSCCLFAFPDGGMIAHGAGFAHHTVPDDMDTTLEPPYNRDPG